MQRHKRASVAVAIVSLVIACVLLIYYVVSGQINADHGFDFIVAAIWVLLLVALVLLLRRRENVRQFELRTVYVGKNSACSPRRGEVSIGSVGSPERAAQIADFAQMVAAAQDYGFDVAEVPEGFQALHAVEISTAHVDKNGELTDWSGALQRLDREDGESADGASGDTSTKVSRTKLGDFEGYTALVRLLERAGA